MLQRARDLKRGLGIDSRTSAATTGVPLFRAVS
jgi:hypothetical protein